MRWSGVLSNLLHTLRHKLTITIDWRPLYALMQRTFTEPLMGMEGTHLQWNRSMLQIHCNEISSGRHIIHSCTVLSKEDFVNPGLAMPVNAH